MKVDHTL